MAAWQENEPQKADITLAGAVEPGSFLRKSSRDQLGVFADAKCDDTMVDYEERADHDCCFAQRDRFPGRLVLALVIGFGVGFAAMA